MSLLPYNRSLLAWEFLKRNTEYRQEWCKLSSPTCKINNAYPFTCFRQNRVEKDPKKWGLLAYANPDAACSYDVFWDPLVTKYNLYGYSFSSVGLKFSAFLQLYKLRATGLVLLDGQLCIRICVGNVFLQIFVPDHRGFSIDQPLHLSIPVPSEKGKLLQGYETLSQIMEGKTLGVEISAEKYLNYLTIYDGIQQGESHKDIAIKLFSPKQVEENWHPDSWMRARIRHGIRRGTQLVKERYLSLL